MKIWHRLEAWILDRKIHKEHRELAKYVRHSAYEIAAWKQDIAFLEERRQHHLAFLGLAPAPEPDKVVSIDEAREKAPPADVRPPRSATN